MSDFSHSLVNGIVLDALAENRSFQEILDLLSGRFRTDLAVFNLDGTCIMHSGSRPAEAPQVSVPADFFSTLEVRGFDLPDGRRCQICPIMTDTQVFGALQAAYTGACADEDARAVAATAARVYRYFFRLGDESQAFNLQNHIIARYLLLGSPLPDQAGFRLADLTEYSASKMKFGPRFAVAVFQSRGPEPVPVSSGALSHLRRYIPNSFALRDGRRLLALIYGLDAAEIRGSRALRTSLNSFCEFTDMICGVSNVFEDLEKRRSCIRQASALVLSSRLLSGPERVLLAEEHYSDAVLCGVMEQTDGRIFLLSDIERLVRHDAEHRTEYLKTLESYLLAAGYFSRAAKTLFVDRGTLKYRMDRIRALISCDPDDPAAAKRLLAAIRIREIYLETRDQAP